MCLLRVLTKKIIYVFEVVWYYSCISGGWNLGSFQLGLFTNFFSSELDLYLPVLLAVQHSVGFSRHLAFSG